MKNKKGFTLVELIAVIALIGVLIIVFVPFLTNVFGKTKTMLNQMDKDQLLDGVKTYLTSLQENGYVLKTDYVYDTQCNIQDALSNYEPVKYKTSNGTEISGYDFVKYAAENDLYVTSEYLVDNGYFDNGCVYNETSCEKSKGCKVSKECTIVVHYNSTRTKANPNCTGDNCEYYYELTDYTTSFLDESKCVIK